jgi:hypothetical protein
MKSTTTFFNSKYPYLWFFLIHIFLLSSTNSYGQAGDFNSSICQIDFGKYFSNAKFYNGMCANGKANGWGSIEWQGGLKTESYFLDDKIQNNLIKYIYQDGVVITPNKGYYRDGPGVFITNNNAVYPRAYSQDQHIGSDWNGIFEINSLTSLNTQNFCLKDDPENNLYYIMHTDIIQVPNSSKVIIQGTRQPIVDGPRRRWLEVVDLDSNKVTMRIGSNQYPILTSHDEIAFVGYDLNNNPNYRLGDNGAILKILVNENRYVKFYEHEKSNSETSLFIPSKQTNQIEQSREVILDGIPNGDRKSHYPLETIQKSRLGYVLKFYNLPDGNGRVELKFMDSLIVQQEFRGMQIRDAVLNERNLEIALSLTTKDSLYLTYLTSTGRTLNFYSSNKETTSYFDLEYSPNYTYLLVFGREGTIFYLGTELYYGIPNEFIYAGISNNEKILVTGDYDGYWFFDLENRRPIYRFTGVGKIVFFENNLYVVTKNKTLHHLHIPEPLVNFSDFELKKYQESLATRLPDAEVSKNDNSKSESTSDTDTMAKLAFYLWILSNAEPEYRINGWDDERKCIECGITWSTSGFHGSKGYQFQKNCYGGYYSGCEFRLAWSTPKYCSRECASRACERATDVMCGSWN